MMTETCKHHEFKCPYQAVWIMFKINTAA